MGGRAFGSISQKGQPIAMAMGSEDQGRKRKRKDPGEEQTVSDAVV